MTIIFDINFSDVIVAPILSCESLVIYVVNGALRISISSDEKT
jgi:hypothetical protein